MANFEEAIRIVLETEGREGVEALRKSLGQMGDVANASASEAAKLADQLATLSESADSIQSFISLKAQLGETNVAIAKESENLAQLKADFAATEKPTDALTSSIAKSEAQLKKLTLAQNRHSVQVEEASRGLTKAGIDTTHLADAQLKLKGEIDGTAKQLGNVPAATIQASAGVNKLEHSSKSAGAEIKELALRLGEIAIAAIGLDKAIETVVEGVKEGIESAAAFESAIASAGAVTGATAEQLVQLKEAAEDAGRTTKFSSEEAADALVALGRASGSAEDAIAELVPTLHLAQAAGIEVADAATQMVQTLADFQLGAENAAHVADLLTSGAKAGGVGLEGFSDELAKTASAAQGVGLDIDHTTAILAALATEGIRGKQASGGLRDAFVALADPTSKFSGHLRSLGIETTDFNEVIAQLAKRGPEARDAIADLSTNAQFAIGKLVADGGVKVRELSGDLGNVAGSAKAAADAMNNTFTGALGELKKSISTAKEDLFTDALKPFADSVRDVADKLDAFAKSPDFKVLKSELTTLFTDAAGTARDFFGAIDFKGLAVTLKSFVVEADTDIKTFRKNLGGIIETVSLIYQAFKFAFDLIKSALLLLVTALAELVRGVLQVHAKLIELGNFDPTGLRHKFGLVSDTAVDTSRSIADGATAAAKALEHTLGKSVDDTTDAFGDLLRKAQDMDDGATAPISHVGEAAKLTAKQVALIEPPAIAAAEALKKAGESATQAIEDLLKGVPGAQEFADAQERAAGRVAAAQKKAAEDARQYKAALIDLGIAGQQTLVDDARKAENAFGLMVSRFREGKSTIEDVRRAFVAYAGAQRAAVADSDVYKQSQVEVQIAVAAAAAGVSDVLDTMGKHGKNAGQNIADGANIAADALLQLQTTAQHETKPQLDALGYEVGSLGDWMTDGGKHADEFSVSLGAMSESAAAAYAATNKLIVGASNFADFQIWGDTINRLTDRINDQRDALKGLNAELDAQLAKYDPLADKLEALKQQYGYLDPAALRQVAEKQQQVEDAQKRADEEKKRATEEAARATAEAQRTQAETSSPTTTAQPAGGAHPLTNPNLGAGALPAPTKHEVLTVRHEIAKVLDGEGIDLSDDVIERIARRVFQMVDRGQQTTYRG